jgi:hypothetical protein
VASCSYPEFSPDWGCLGTFGDANSFLNNWIHNSSSSLRKGPSKDWKLDVSRIEAQKFTGPRHLEICPSMHQQTSWTTQPKLQPISAHQAFRRTLTKLFCAAYTCQATLSISWCLLATIRVLVAPNPGRSRPHHWRHPPEMRGRTGGDVTTMKNDGRGSHATPYRCGHSESSRFIAALSAASSGMVRAATGSWDGR